MNHSENHRLSPLIPVRWKAGIVGALMCCAVGCGSLNMFRSDNELAAEDPFRNASDRASIEDVQGPLQRNLFAGFQRDNRTPTEREAEGFRRYDLAQKAFDAGDYEKAEEMFKKLADDHAVDDTGFFRKRRLGDLGKTRKQLEATYYDNPLLEDSLFMLAESRYKQEEFPGAEDVYLQLLKKYPNTRHLDTSSQRLFEIARTWMEFKTATTDDVSVASYTEDGRPSDPKIAGNESYDRPGFFNFSDRKRPWTDTEGRALEALKAIWLNDPTGPLADDALMLTASHYLRIGRYAEAAETYRLLREEFPDSPHLKDAYVLGSYVTQSSYQGAAYDDRSLTEAEQLKQMTLNLFPNLTPEERSRVQDELVRVSDARVARDFDRALFWLRKGQFEAVEMSCYQIINRNPDSKYAGKARSLLKRLPEYQGQNTLLLAMQGISAEDFPEIPADSTPSTPPATPPQTTQPPARPVQPPTEPTPPPEEDSKAPRYLPSWDLPKLKPIPVPSLWPEKKPETPIEDAPPFENNSPGQQESGKVNLTLGSE